MKKNITFADSLLFIVTIIGIFGFNSASSLAESKKAIQIKGSDTMVNIAQAWVEEFNRIRPDVNIAVTGGGSGTGIAALINGTCDIAESSRRLEEKEQSTARSKSVEPNEEKVALDGIAVVVHPLNPVKNLTMGQLRDIFMGNIRNWKELGGENRPIVMLSREVNSGTHLFFKEHVLRKGVPKGAEEFSPSALLMPSSQAIADEVSNNINAVGYYGMGYISQAQKAIAVAVDTKSPFIEPTIQNVKNNAYPISRPLYLYTNGKPQGLIKDFIDFVYSEKGQEIVKKMDFVPIK